MKLAVMQGILRKYTLRCDYYAIGPTLSTERIFSLEKHLPGESSHADEVSQAII